MGTRTSAPAAPPSGIVQQDPKDHSLAHVDPWRQRIWDQVSHSPVHSLWDFQGIPPKVILKRSFHAFNDDDLLSRAAELGYYFLFALFPTLISVSSILGLAAKSASATYVKLLDYLALVIPPSAFNMVVDTFNQTTRASTGGKFLFGLAAALWSASVGFAAIQDTLNIVYKTKETRPYWKARGSAILVTLLLSLMVTLILGCLLGGDLFAVYLAHHMYPHSVAAATSTLTRAGSWIVATVLLMFLFSTIYYFAPDVQNKRWHWFTPGARARHRRLVDRLRRPARLPPLLQQLLGDLRLAGRGHHSAHLVLHHRPDAADRGGDQLRDRRGGRREGSERRRDALREHPCDSRRNRPRGPRSQPRGLKPHSPSAMGPALPGTIPREPSG